MCNTHDSQLVADPNFRATHRPAYMTGWWGLWCELEERWLGHSRNERPDVSTHVYMSREAAEFALSHLPEVTRQAFAPARFNPNGYFPAEEE